MKMDHDTYHYDFTTASELEIFIARLEEIIQEWGLHQKPIEEPLKKDYFKTKEWISATETLTFSEAEFILIRHYIKCQNINIDEIDSTIPENMEDTPSTAILDMMSTENDFFKITKHPFKDSHIIARWYGLRDFLILIPQHSSCVASESRAKILLSAVTIAASNIKCKIPIFLQALEPWQCYYLGVFESGCFHTDFSMIHLKHTPLHCKYLTGLLTIFKSKIGSEMLLNPVTVSVQFTYALKEWSQYNAAIQESPLDVMGNDLIDTSDIDNLPFGSNYDSVSELYLIAAWPSLLDNCFVDGENYSDLDPLQAPIWKVSITTVDNPSCLLSDYYTEFVALTKAKYSITELLGNLVSSNTNFSASNSDVCSSLNVLTESKISAFSKAMVGSERNSRKDSNRQSQQADHPISTECLMVLLYYLFPDADANYKVPYGKNLEGKSSSSSAQEENIDNMDKRLSGMKSAPYDSLLWRLSIVMANLIHSLGGIRAAAYFWYEFTQELRFRWENSILIPGVEKSHPDSRTCLLYQKLQLLNCCINQRIEREKEACRNTNADESDSEVDEEFYDCDAEVGETEEGKNRKAKSVDKPMGRLAKHGELKLLESGEALYIPITQGLVPKTEDQVEEDTRILLELGSDAAGSELRAKLMSAYLLSDMEAFKAANPGCVLGDFLRWYSPRDWIEEKSKDGQSEESNQPKGHLSHRMQIPGNTWVEVWETAKPVPAKWQKRHFNDTRESEKVLDFLERKTPKEFIELLLPVMTSCVIQKLLEEATIELPGISEILTKLIKKAEILARMPKVEGNRYEELVNEMTAVETLLVHSRSLINKFSLSKDDSSPEVMEFIKNLLANGEAEVPGGKTSEIGSKIRYYFTEATKVEQLLPESGNQLATEKWNTVSPFPSPCEKEIILRVSTAKGPQRLHVTLKKNECRLCGAFTKNIYFPN